MIVVIAGSPADGFRFFGPFADLEEAVLWAEDNPSFDEPYWVVALEPPSKVH